MSIDLKKTLSQVLKSFGAYFVLRDKPISYEDILSETGLLPAIAKRADQLCSLCLGYGIGVTFIDMEKSLLGVKVQFDETTPTVLRLLCMIDILSELVNNSSSKERVSLDELMYD
jgi:intracellular multiplication protein IcmS